MVAEQVRKECERINAQIIALANEKDIIVKQDAGVFVDILEARGFFSQRPAAEKQQEVDEARNEHAVLQIPGPRIKLLKAAELNYLDQQIQGLNAQLIGLLIQGTTVSQDVPSPVPAPPKPYQPSMVLDEKHCRRMSAFAGKKGTFRD